jgi:hypothetical protein
MEMIVEGICTITKEKILGVREKLQAFISPDEEWKSRQRYNGQSKKTVEDDGGGEVRHGCSHSAIA